MKGADGENFVLPAEKHGKNGFGKSVATGQYTLVATLPTGYELAEEAPLISVVAGGNNNYRIGVISKVDLLAALNKQVDVIKTTHYFNASADKKEAYDQAFQTVALLGIDPTVKQEQINQALAELSRAEGKLKGKATDFSSLGKYQEKTSF